MSNTTPPTSASNLIVNDKQYEVVPRRRSERRSVNERQEMKSELVVENEGIKVQNVDKIQVELFTGDDRRLSARRSSKPTLLSATEISKLRKK